jgi:type II secretory ATPase GspE/PulE/Tfp pilus assembly ATPase PilB-like protein
VIHPVTLAGKKVGNTWIKNFFATVITDSFSMADPRYAVSSPADLSPANLGPANLSPANLGPADLSPSDLSPADSGPAENPSAATDSATGADRIESRIDATIERMVRLVDSIANDHGDQDESVNREASAAGFQPVRTRVLSSRSPASQCMRQLAEAYAQRYLMPCFDPPGVVLPPIDPRLSTLLPARLCRDAQIVPLADDGQTIDVAVVSPDAFAVREQIENECGRKMRPMFAPLDVVDGLIDSLYGESDSWRTIDPSGENLTAATASSLSVRESTASQARDFLDRLLRHAIKQSATHVHLDRVAGRWHFRIRIDGVLVPLRSPNGLVGNRVALTIRKLAKLTPSQAPEIATGWLRVRQAQRRIAIQVVGGTRSEGETLVLRFPDRREKSAAPTSHPPGSTPCVLNPADRAAVRRLMAGSAGITMIASASFGLRQQIVSSVLRCIDSQRNAIWTVDQISEPRSSHVGDSPTEPFSGPIQSLLNLDPDVLVVPELSATVTWADCRLATERGCQVIVGIEAESADQAMRTVREGEASWPGVAGRVLMVVDSTMNADGSPCLRVRRPSSK